jgi:hypothetical protein
MLNQDPDFFTSRIPDLGSIFNQKNGKKALKNIKTWIGSGIRDQRFRIWKNVSRIPDPDQL